MRDKRAFTFRVERGRFARTVRGHPGSCLAVTLLTILWAVWLVFFKQHGPGSGPPQWTELREYERTLPQHNLSLPLPEGRHGRYVRFNQQIRQLGWNNVLNEMCVAVDISRKLGLTLGYSLLNLETAHQANRAYVFEDYTWKVRSLTCLRGRSHSYSCSQATTLGSPLAVPVHLPKRL
jgi:hypothetical protein